jgi:hypothetical protein
MKRAILDETKGWNSYNGRKCGRGGGVNDGWECGRWKGKLTDGSDGNVEEGKEI